MKYISFVWFLFISQLSFATEQFVAEVGAEFWVNPRNGEAIIGYEPIATTVDKLLAEPEAYLVLRHPEGESGELWGVELQAWLVSLGLVSDRIELQSGYEGLDGVGLYIVSPDVEVEEPLADVGTEELIIDVEAEEPLVDVEAEEPLVDVEAEEPLVDIEIVNDDEAENTSADIIEQEVDQEVDQEEVELQL